MTNIHLYTLGKYEQKRLGEKKVAVYQPNPTLKLSYESNLLS